MAKLTYTGAEVQALLDKVNDLANLTGAVTIEGDQAIEGLKDFINGFQIGGALVKYDTVKKCFIFTENVLFEKGMAWNSRLEDFTKEEIFSITKAVDVDWKTIGKNASGQLYVINGGGEGGGGNYDPDFLHNYLTNNKYITEPYVNSLLTEYLPKSSISDWALESTKPTYTASEVGALAQDSSSTNADLDTILGNKTVVLKPFFQSFTSNNIGSARKGVLRMSYNGSESQLLFDHYNRLLQYRTIGSNPQNWATIAFTSDLPTKLSQLTDDIVKGNYLSTSGGTVTGNILATGNVSAQNVTANRGITAGSVLSFIDTDASEKIVLQRNSSGDILFCGGFADRDVYIDGSILRVRTENTIFSRGISTTDVKLRSGNNSAVISYNSSKNAFILPANLLVEGGFAWNAKIDGFDVPTITDAVSIDGTSIIRDGGVLRVNPDYIQSVSGLNENELANYLTNNKYITESALTPYAKTTDVNSLLTEYLPKSSISDWALESTKPTYTASEVGALAQDSSSTNADLDTILGNKTVVLKPFFQSFTSNNIGSARKGVLRMSYNGSESQLLFDHYNRLLQYRTIGSNPQNWATIAFTSDLPTKLSQLTDDIVKGNYLSTSGGTVNGRVTFENASDVPLHLTSPASATYMLFATETDNAWIGYRGGFEWVLTNKNWTQTASIIHSHNISEYALSITGGTVNGNITAPKFIGALQGNADSATNADMLDDKHLSDIPYARFSGGGLGTSEESGRSASLSRTMFFRDNDEVCGDGPEKGIIGYNVLHSLADTYGMQLVTTYADSMYFVRTKINGEWGKWRKLATTEDNVASATKLTTPRKIWGHDFDGTDNVYGNIFPEESEGCYYHEGGISYHIGKVFKANIVRVTSDYNVAIGGNTADEKLHVHGNILATDTITANSTLITGGTAYASALKAKSICIECDENGAYDSKYDGDINRFGGALWIQASSGNDLYLGGTYANTTIRSTLEVNKAATFKETLTATTQMMIGSYDAPSQALEVRGNILATGRVAWNSSRVLKTEVKEHYLSLEKLAQIKPYSYKWKDGRDNLVHVGAIADEVMEILPETVLTDSLGIHSMDYAQTAYVMAASLTPYVSDHERRIKELEKRMWH